MDQVTDISAHNDGRIAGAFPILSRRSKTPVVLSHYTFRRRHRIYRQRCQYPRFRPDHDSDMAPLLFVFLCYDVPRCRGREWHRLRPTGYIYSWIGPLVRLEPFFPVGQQSER